MNGAPRTEEGVHDAADLSVPWLVDLRQVEIHFRHCLAHEVQGRVVGRRILEDCRDLVVATEKGTALGQPADPASTANLVQQLLWQTLPVPPRVVRVEDQPGIPS